jgi:hypothetical protein
LEPAFISKLKIVVTNDDGHQCVYDCFDIDASSERGSIEEGRDFLEGMVHVNVGVH